MATRLNRYLDAVSAFDNIEIGLLSGSTNPLRGPDQDVGELMESIREHGLLEPIIVRPRGSRFEVLAGNRRLKACKLLKHRRVKCIVTDLDDAGALEVAIAENVQRKTLTPLEEAAAFKRYCEKFGWGSQTQLANKIGKSQEYVSHRMKLLDLPGEALDALRRGKISATGAEELVWLKTEGERSTALKLLEDEKVTTKSVRKVSESRLQPVAGEGATGGPDFYERRTRDEQTEGKLLTEAILILRISLVRLDGVLAKAKDTDLRRLLLSKRYALHQLVDELVRMRSGEGAVVARARAPRGYQSISFRKS